MSVQNKTPFNSYTANGATTVFPFTFLLLEAGDLIVELDGVVQSVGFTLAGVGAPAGGSVTFTVAPANGVKVLLKRVLTLQRLTDYQNNGDLLAATLNKDFDRIWQSMQQLQQNDIRALKLPFDTPTDQVIPESATTRANKGVKFDASGNLILSNFDPDGAQDDATAAAATATTQAGIATTQAGIATTQAGIATTQAGIATTQAGIATTQAEAAAGSAAAAQAAVGAVLVDASDTTAGKLSSKLIAGSGITLTVQSPGGNESLRIDGQQPGEVCYFARNTAPTGFLKANGATVSRTTYAALFAAIGTAFGAGDGSTTFNLPDLRAEFVRGWDDSRGVDSGRAFGSAQTDAMQGHRHQLFALINAALGGGSTHWNLGAGPAANDYARDLLTDGVNGTPRTAAETRPRNIALLACIKY